MPGDIRTNALDDLLDAERHFRQQAENAVRELRGVLTELAQRLAGVQIEAARRTDPLAPENWGPERWRKFFANLPAPAASGDGWNDPLAATLEQLKNENQVLKGKLAALTSSSAQTSASHTPRPGAETSAAVPMLDEPERAVPPQPVHNAPVIVELNTQSRALAHETLLCSLRELQLPAALPARFEGHFPKAGLTEADWERQTRRKLYVLYLLSQGMNARLEIDYLLSQMEGLSSRAGALKRVYDNMQASPTVEKGLIRCEVLEMSAPNTSLATLHLTPEGAALCRILGWEFFETERQRMIRLRQGDLSPQRTLAVMIFALHARFRGYQVSVLPQVDGVETGNTPDIAIARGLPDQAAEMLYVAVEPDNKEAPEKWLSQAPHQNRVALCARNVQRRARLIGECKLKNLHGLATDLETLIACKVPDITSSTPLWAEEW